MPAYSYIAYESAGDKTEGRLVAESEPAAAQELLRRGLQPVEIRRVDPRRSGLRRIGLRRRFGNRERALFARQLSDLVGSGMPVLDALNLLEEQSDSAGMGSALRALQASVQDGNPLARAMESMPREFGPVHVSLVRAGERAGLLSVVLGQIAALEEREQELKRQVQAALLYPSITAVVGVATVLVVLNFVVPRLSSIFDEMGQALPLITRWLLAMSAAAQWIWGPGFLLVLALVIALRLAPKPKQWKTGRDRLLLRLPKAGHLLQSMQIARFSGTLAALLRNGVSMVPALSVTADTLSNRHIQMLVREVVERVNRGDRLGAALEGSRAFPRVVSGMISVGENTGSLETTLERIRDTHARESDRATRMLVGLVEPGLILIMGVFVAFLVAAVIIPIFQVNLVM